MSGIRGEPNELDRVELPPAARLYFPVARSSRLLLPPILVSRRFRFLTVLLALLSLLLSTAALAGYACGGSDTAVQVAQMFDAGTPGAESVSQAMDEEQPELCHGHCQSGQKSADSFQPPAFAKLTQVGPVLAVPAVAPPLAPPSGVTESQLRRQSGPSLAVRHCCYRT